MGGVVPASSLSLFLLLMISVIRGGNTACTAISTFSTDTCIEYVHANMK
jgi:hypothetical protein